MSAEVGNERGGTALGFGIGLVTGAALGAGLALVLAAKEGEAWRRSLRVNAQKIKERAVDGCRRAGEWADRGKEVADRLRTAASEGLREARRHSAAPRDPRSADLAGVEGLVDVLEPGGSSTQH